MWLKSVADFKMYSNDLIEQTRRMSYIQKPTHSETWMSFACDYTKMGMSCDQIF